MDTPRTLQEAIVYFADFEHCRQFLMDLRWPDGKVACPACGSERVIWMARVRRWKCYEKHIVPQFSLKTGTIFEDSPLGVDKWLAALWLLVNCKNGISSCEIARDLGITQKSAWFMAHRLRFALHHGSFDKLSGELEADETYVGGKARNMSKARRVKKGISQKRSMAGKVAVMGLLDRHGKDGQSTMRLQVVDGRKKSHFMPVIAEHIETGSTIHTDSHPSYAGLTNDFVHKVIDHAEKYVDGTVHTNGCENFWSLLKRALKGTYVSVEPFHLFRYLDEQAYRFNNRTGANDFDRFRTAAEMIVGRRLTWKQLVGQVPDGAAWTN